MKWFRMNEMSGSGERQVEKWLREDNGTIQEFDIDLYLGKKTDLSTFKKNSEEKNQEKP